MNPTEALRTQTGKSAYTIPLLLFSLALFASATLLFWVEPLFARMVLPLLGGSPAVWNTCLVFFQGALMLGYLYAHLTTRWLGVKNQLFLHFGLLLLAFVTLPVAIPQGAEPPAASNPIPWLLWVLLVGLGAPFVVLSATAPLLQRWFSHTSHPAAGDPYFLYASSNAGSLTALLAYPLILEPNLRLTQQSQTWTVGYVILIALIASCALATWRYLTRPVSVESAGSVASSTDDRAPPLDRTGSSITGARRLRWLALAFVPSSLLLGVTTHLTTDVAAVPFLWIVPLSLYLLSFVVVFARRRLVSTVMASFVHALAVPTLLILGFWGIQGALSWEFTLHLGVFFATALLLHGRLADDRPATRHLTEFYLWMSIGGVLGGMFNALLAPNLFDRVIEYELMILAACLLRPTRADQARSFGLRTFGPSLRTLGRSLRAFGPSLFPALVLLGAFALGLDNDSQTSWLSVLIVSLLAGGLVLATRHSALRFTTSVLALAVAVALAEGQRTEDELVVMAERSFFGSYTITSDVAERVYTLNHGTTVHGMQYRDPARRTVPLSYYHSDGPVGDAFQALDPTLAGGRIAVIGLGTGAMACHGQPGQEWTFYEIDPGIADVARDDRYFTYLRDCPPVSDVVLGDGRLTLQRAPAAHYELIVLDAFSSDAIPVHLLTREALALYLSKLAPDGTILAHISNRYVFLELVVASLAEAEGLDGLVRFYEGPDPSEPPVEDHDLVYESDWVILARDSAVIAGLFADPNWEALGTQSGHTVWTDDFSNLIQVLDWRSDPF